MSSLNGVSRALLALLVFCPCVCLPDVQSVLPDFYSEPGLHPFRDTVQENVVEHIDPFSGTLHLAHTDLYIPGNGGFDLKIIRSYNSNNVYASRKTATALAPNLTQLLPRTPTGLGWTIHFGRVIRSGGQTAPNPCDTGTSVPGGDTLDNPVLELQDGSQQPLFVNATGFSATWITKDQWVAYCPAGTSGMVAISPDGVKYTMSYLKGSGTITYYDDQRIYSWYTTRIEDRNGNWATINYNTAAVGGHAVISSISASDGRSISFSYTDTTNANGVRLTAIIANGETWSYQYLAVPADTSGRYYLTQVSRPDGLSWRYSYHALTSGSPGNRALQTVTYPHGATATYQVRLHVFHVHCGGGLSMQPGL